MSKDTFVVTGSSEFGPTAAQSAAVQAASGYAHERGRQMLSLTAQRGSRFMPTGEQISTYELQFRVVDEDDPEWGRSTLKPAADTTIEIEGLGIKPKGPPAGELDSPTPSVYMELQKLRSLLDEGTLTEAEFAALKAKLIEEV